MNSIHVPHIFDYQSTFDSTKLEKSVNSQAPGDGIVSPQESNIQGYGISLHPDSETPIAIRFKKDEAGNKAQVRIMKPGETIFPHGREDKDKFQGFTWGLPFGWLGGGLASLVIHRSPRAEVDWPARHGDMIIQRQRMKIQPANISLDAAHSPVPNWPTRFPSFGTRGTYSSGSYTDPINLGGQPLIVAHPTLTMVRLFIPANTLPGPASVRLMMFGTDSFDKDAVSQAMLFQDITFPQFSAAGTLAGSGTGSICYQGPVQTFDAGPLVRLGCESASGVGVIAVSLGDGAAANGGVDPLVSPLAYLDIVRYGRL
jgi:hypothetical protein